MPIILDAGDRYKIMCFLATYWRGLVTGNDEELPNDSYGDAVELMRSVYKDLVDAKVNVLTVYAPHEIEEGIDLDDADKEDNE